MYYLYLKQFGLYVYNRPGHLSSRSWVWWTTKTYQLVCYSFRGSFCHAMAPSPPTPTTTRLVPACLFLAMDGARQALFHFFQLSSALQTRSSTLSSFSNSNPHASQVHTWHLFAGICLRMGLKIAGRGSRGCNQGAASHWSLPPLTQDCPSMGSSQSSGFGYQTRPKQIGFYEHSQTRQVSPQGLELDTFSPILVSPFNCMKMSYWKQMSGDSALIGSL